ncbi:MAG: hypothetical protein IJ718_05165 [Paludibacteraceae bacterium]|nr:hypothetical protein [Paludibacteraceae bacterium]
MRARIGMRASRTRRANESTKDGCTMYEGFTKGRKDEGLKIVHYREAPNRK